MCLSGGLAILVILLIMFTSYISGVVVAFIMLWVIERGWINWVFDGTQVSKPDYYTYSQPVTYLHLLKLSGWSWIVVFFGTLSCIYGSTVYVCKSTYNWCAVKLNDKFNFKNPRFTLDQLLRTPIELKKKCEPNKSDENSVTKY